MREIKEKKNVIEDLRSQLSNAAQLHRLAFHDKITSLKNQVKELNLEEAKCFQVDLDKLMSSTHETHSSNRKARILLSLKYLLKSQSKFGKPRQSVSSDLCMISLFLVNYLNHTHTIQRKLRITFGLNRAESKLWQLYVFKN